MNIQRIARYRRRVSRGAPPERGRGRGGHIWARAPRSPTRFIRNGPTPTRSSRASASTTNRLDRAAALSRSSRRPSPSVASRYAARSRRSLQGLRIASVSHDHRRRRAGGQRQRILARPAASGWSNDCQHLSGRYHPMGRSGDQEAESEARAAKRRDRAGVPFWTDPAPTFLFSDYLSKSASELRHDVGAQHVSSVARCGIGAKGNEGVANMTTQTDGAIGHVEYAYAKQNKMALHAAHQQGRQGRRRPTRSRSSRRG